MRAILFPGQGSQYVGMGSDFYERYDSVKKIFDTVDKTLGFSLSKLILNGPEEELKLTLEGLLEPETKEEVLGKAVVLEMFKIPKQGFIAGKLLHTFLKFSMRYLFTWSKFGTDITTLISRIFMY